MSHVTGESQRPMPKPTFHNLPAEKRQRIIDAAIDEFAAWPYAKATLDRIVDAAEISKGSMYQYFGGKADLYRYLLTEYMAQKKMAAIGASMPGPGASVWEVLESAFLSGVRFAAAEPKLTQLGVRFLRDHALEPELAAVSAANRAAADAWLTGLLTEAQARGELRPDVSIPVAAGFLAHALGEGILEQLARLVGLPYEAFLDEPGATASLSDDQLLALVRSVTSLFRDGAGVRGGTS